MSRNPGISDRHSAFSNQASAPSPSAPPPASDSSPAAHDPPLAADGSALRTPHSALGTSLRNWAELARLPNIFTAIADPLAGAMLAGAGWRDTGRVIVILMASACFYAGGTILNDWNDFRRDRIERPQRPIPSGRIARWHALAAATALLLFAAFMASALDTATGGLGVLLLASIITYDVLMKDIPIAPLLMGVARALNLLLGMSAVSAATTAAAASAGAAALPSPSGTLRAYTAAALCLYVLGLTVFARREAGRSRKDQLVLGAAFSAAGLAALAPLHLLFEKTLPSAAGGLWLAILAGAVAYTMIQAILTPAPARIQRAVKTAVLGIILFDATLAAFRCGLPISCCVVVLLIPAVWLGRWLYST